MSLWIVIKSLEVTFEGEEEDWQMANVFFTSIKINRKYLTVMINGGIYRNLIAKSAIENAT